MATYPNLLGQWIQEAEHTRFLLDGLLDHYGDAQGHERFAKVNDALTFRRNSHRCDRNIRFLFARQRNGLLMHYLH